MLLRTPSRRLTPIRTTTRAAPATTRAFAARSVVAPLPAPARATLLSSRLCHPAATTTPTRTMGTDAAVASSELKVLRRSDYTPVPYTAKTVDLDVSIHDGHTNVTGNFALVPNPKAAPAPAGTVAPLVLYRGAGAIQEIVAIKINGAPVPYAADDKHVTLTPPADAAAAGFKLTVEAKIKPEANTMLEVREARGARTEPASGWGEAPPTGTASHPAPCWPLHFVRTPHPSAPHSYPPSCRACTSPTPSTSPSARRRASATSCPSWCVRQSARTGWWPVTVLPVVAAALLSALTPHLATRTPPHTPPRRHLRRTAPT